MRLIDRFILKEFLGPFLFGIGTFMIILVGVQLSPWMLRLLVRDHYPADIVSLIFLYRLPGALALTFPMATVFGSLMCIASLSSNGEIIAMRAGSVSLLRLSRPVLVAGLAISVLSISFNELLVPTCNDAAYQLISKYALNARPLEHMTFSIPSKGEPQRIVYVKLFDPGRKQLTGLTIMEMKDGKYWQVFSAEKAEWLGPEWQLSNVTHAVVLPDGAERREHLALVKYDVGKSPAEMAKQDKDPIDMSLQDLLRELERRRKLGRTRVEIMAILQTIHTRMALPWASLGFALIGIPLGLRPVRATTGIGLGLSLVIVFAYYVIFNTVNLMGQQGSMNPVLSAWLPNCVLFGAGLGLFSSARR